ASLDARGGAGLHDLRVAGVVGPGLTEAGSRGQRIGRRLVLARAGHESCQLHQAKHAQNGTSVVHPARLTRPPKKDTLLTYIGARLAAPRPSQSRADPTRRSGAL